MWVLKCGEVAPAIRERVGDYESWFAPAFHAVGMEADVVWVHRGARLPQRPMDGIVITGSPLSLVTPETWMCRLAESVKRLAQARVPILGVCFGHQLLALAHGVPVVRSPNGREIGSVEIALTAAGRSDPLFASLPPRLLVQATHEDAPQRLPPGAVALAVNAHGLQAMALGPYVRGVQFHPELSAAGMSAVLQTRATTLKKEGRSVRELLAGVGAAPFAVQILHNFLSHFVAPVARERRATTEERGRPRAPRY